MLKKFQLIIILFILLILIDWYAFQAVKTVFFHTWPEAMHTAYGIFWSTAFLSVVLLFFAMFSDFFRWPTFFRVYVVTFVIMVYFSKLFSLVFIFIDDMHRAVLWAISFFSATATNQAYAVEKIGRSLILNQAALLFGFIPFATMLYGVMIGAFNYGVSKLTIRLPNLPRAFHGFKIAQISDIHAGSFAFTSPVNDGISLLLSQEADVIFFTGDMVNYKTEEVRRIRKILSRVIAPMGVYSVLGNHDYGDYLKWPSEREKESNLKDMLRLHDELGWKLLNNTHQLLEKDGEKIAIVGVENWGTKGRFQQYGNLDLALEGTEDIPCKLLLSHDPAHWAEQVLKNYPDIDVTFSGHTHGMQFGLDIPGLKWSPVQYVYKRWHGLYREGMQYLYVNRGFGFIGYPGRVGMNPEITVVTLERGE